MKVTEQAIREAMKLAPGVAVTLGTLEEPTRTRIAVVGSGLYTLNQIAYTVTMTLQFAAHNPAVVGYPTEVKFDLADTDKLKKMQAAVSEFVTVLQAEGDHEGAAKIAAILTLPCEDIETVHDALVAGLSKSQFIEQLEANGTTARRYRNFIHGRDGGLGVFARNVGGVIQWDMCPPSPEQDVMSGEINDENRAIYQEIVKNAPKSVTDITSTNSVRAPDIRSKRFAMEADGSVTSAGGEGGNGPISTPAKEEA